MRSACTCSRCRRLRLPISSGHRVPTQPLWERAPASATPVPVNRCGNYGCAVARLAGDDTDVAGVVSGRTGAASWWATTRASTDCPTIADIGSVRRRDNDELVGGGLVIAGVVIWFLWSFWLGLIVALVGLVAFGGFVRGRWYEAARVPRLVGCRLFARPAGQVNPSLVIRGQQLLRHEGVLTMASPASRLVLATALLIGALAISGAAAASHPATPAAPDFGPNVKIFDPSMSTSAIKATVDAIAAQQLSNQFGTERYALLFVSSAPTDPPRIRSTSRWATTRRLPDSAARRTTSA